ncbi:CHAT domain-containing protein [Rubinisphaera italica]|uniref:CHAT domain protein n=1 Tax=Rubinisphaera italica TaxID=2527969 RepID=A0A5C5XF25_9PLAN|nr:CHAT domain-containing protein [Rubinisphaera italica]TWT60953.1 CHAT domain protein [Rubinisphaera italica]
MQQVFNWEQSLKCGTLPDDVKGMCESGRVEELIACPDHVLEECLRQFRDGDSAYGWAMLEIGKADIDSLGPRVLWLKRLAEASIFGLGTFHYEHVESALQPRIHLAIRKEFKRRGMAHAGLFQNPPVDFGTLKEHCDPDGFLPGILYATTFRYFLVKSAEFHTAWLVLVADEVERWLSTGYERDANETLQWIEEHIERATAGEPSEEDRTNIRMAASLCGSAYKRLTADLDTSARLYELAIEHGQPSGDDRAADTFYLSEIRRKQERFEDAHDLLQQILNDTDVHDEELLALTRQSSSQIEVELTGNPSRLQTAAVPTPEFANLPAVFETLHRFASKLKHKQPLRDDEIVDGIQLFLMAQAELIMAEDQWPIDPTILTTSIQMAYSLDDASTAETLLPKLVRSYNASWIRIASVERRHIEQLLRGLAERIDFTEELYLPEEPRGTQNEPLRLDHVKSQLALKYLHFLETGEAGLLDGVDCPAIIAQRKEQFLRRTTPDSLLPLIADTRQFAEFVCADFLIDSGCPAELLQPNRSEEAIGEFAVSVQRNHRVDELYAFLTSTANWVRLGYREQVIASLWRAGDTSKQAANFELQCEKLAELLMAKDILFERELLAGANECASAIQDIELSRNMLVADHVVQIPVPSDESPTLDLLPGDVSVGFLVHLPNVDTHSVKRLSALYLFFTDRVECTVSVRASENRRSVHEATTKPNRVVWNPRKPETVVDLRDTLIAARDKAEVSLPLATSLVAFTDFTTLNTPLAATDLSQCTTVVESLQPTSEISFCKPTIAFWGGFGESFSNDLPHAKSEAELFEQWERSGFCHIHPSSRGRSTRKQFINAEWQGSDILHISTHGNAYSGVPDASHLMLGRGAHGKGTVIHYNDILRCDFSNVRLVVLIACLTKFGDQWAGDEDLSLAWAFRAAGVELVIGCRWEIPDLSCLTFTRHFYQRLVGERESVSKAFGNSIAAIKSEFHEHPQIWSAFALLN